MRTLDKKLLRDLWSIKTQVLAIAAVVAAGISMMTMYSSTFDSLARARTVYYQSYRFADVFAGLKRGPARLAKSIAEITGVATVETRVVAEVVLDIEGLPEPAVGRLVSTPENHRPQLNDVFLRRGRYLNAERPDEILINEAFADAHGFGPGDRVAAVLNGRRRELEIVGVALSPEFVYVLPSGGMMPDNLRYGVLWMGRRALAAAFDMEGGFNDVALSLAPDASLDTVTADLDRLLEPYGGLGAIDRSLQSSNWFVENELNELTTFGSILPVIFLGVAAFLLHVVLSRTIAVQRPQIAALKALGYSNGELAGHYGKIAMAIGLLGAVLGLAAGARLGLGFTNLYNEYFRFPIYVYILRPGVVLRAVAVSLAAAGLGAWSAVRRAVVLPPAQAMQPEPPGNYRESWIERLGVGLLLAEPGRIVLRNLVRRPLRFAFSVLGIAMAVAILIVGSFFLDALELVMELQFEVAQRHDMTVTLVEPRAEQAIFEISRLPGVLRAEEFQSFPVRLRAGHRSRRLAVLGLRADSDLFRVVDQRGSVLPVPLQGMMISSKLAELLRVEAGDSLRMEVLVGRRTASDVQISAVADELMGLSAYMDIEVLSRTTREGPLLSGAFLSVDPHRIGALHHRLKHTPYVAGVTLTKAALRSFRETIVENLGLMITFNLLFAGIIAFGVVYNSARVSLSEHQRDLASLRVLGFTKAEISMILLAELATVTLVAIPVGLVIGRGLAALTLLMYDNELIRIPLVIEHSTYASSAAAVLVASALSGLVVRRRLDHLDLISALKTRA